MRVGGARAARDRRALRRRDQPRSRGRDRRAATFRQDLYFRLNGVTLVRPAAARAGPRDRAARAPLPRRGVARARPHADAHARGAGAARGVRWPGNIRELRNVIERAVLLCGDGDITPRALPVEKMTSPISRASVLPVPERSSTGPHAVPPATLTPTELKTDTYPSLGALGPAGLKGELEALERQRILDALERCVWNQTKAAQLLGVSRGVLIARLDQYGIARPRKPRGE